MAEKGFTVEEQQKLRHVLNSIEDLTLAGKEEEEKAGVCVSEDDIQRIIDLGLGRGIDATNPSPWKNKTAYQVRTVTFANIIGTEEGGCVQSYERDVSSASETRGRASASVTDPKSAISIGVEAEYAQSSSERSKVVGTKVLNRTISFKDHCIDSEVLPHLESDSFEARLCKWIVRKANGGEMVQRQVLADTEQEHLQLKSVEVKLKAAIDDNRRMIEEVSRQIGVAEKDLEKIQNRKQMVLAEKHKAVDEKTQPKDPRVQILVDNNDLLLTELTQMETELKSEVEVLLSKTDHVCDECSRNENNLAVLQMQMKSLTKEMEKKSIEFHQMFKDLSISDDEKIVKYCTRFISEFRITHYVSSIQLGASGYEVLTQSKLSRKLGIGGNVGVEKIATSIASITHSKTNSHRASNVRRIGVIELKDGIPTVKRGSHQEAVVGIQVKPISDLIKMKELRGPLKKALVKYLRSEGEGVAGPFYVHCATSGDKNLYWTVDRWSNCLVATSAKKNASKFYIKPSNNPKHPEEFYICYYDRDLHCVHAEHQVDETKECTEPIPCYLKTPTNALGSAPGPLQLGYHVKSKETRLILTNCVRKHSQPPVSLSLWMNGREACFIQCSRRRQRKGFVAVTEVEGKYLTSCVHSRDNEEKSSTFMLFQLVKTPNTKTGKPDKSDHTDFSVNGVSQQIRVTLDERYDPTVQHQQQQNRRPHLFQLPQPLEAITEDDHSSMHSDDTDSPHSKEDDQLEEKHDLSVGDGNLNSVAEVRVGDGDHAECDIV